MLEFDLNIKKDMHRCEILSWISNLSRHAFSGLGSKKVACGQLITSLEESHSVYLSGLCSDKSLYPNTIYEGFDQDVDSTAESEHVKVANSRTYSEDSSNPTILGPLTMLVLSPRKDAEKGIKLKLEDILSRFRDFGCVIVDISQAKNQTYKVILKMKNGNLAIDQARDLGYHVEIKKPKVPTPTSPIVCKCLVTIKVLKRKSSGPSWVKKNTRVLVDQLKKGRARLVKKLENGDHEPYGWIRIIDSNGNSVLELLTVD